MVRTPPGSLSEGAAERSEAEGVSFDGSSGPMVTRKPLLSLKFLSGYEHQSTPPRVGAGGNIPHNVNHPPAGCFASGRVIFFGFCVGVCFAIQPGTCETVGLRAIFIALRKLCNFLPVTSIGVHSLSLAFARQLPQGGSREGCVPFIGVLAKIRGYGRLSSPLRKVSFYQAS